MRFLSSWAWVGLISLVVTVQPMLITNAENCQPKNIEELSLPAEVGNFIYRDSIGAIISTNPHFSIKEVLGGDTQISPNGEFLAATNSADGQTTLTEVFNYTGELIYSGAPSDASIVDVRWLKNEKIMSFFVKRVARDPLSVVGGSEFNFGYFLIDPFSQQYTFILPPPEPPFYTEPPSKPFIEGLYEFTYDGRYLYNDKPIFDFEVNQPLTLQNFRWGIPAIKSHRLISVDYATYRSEGKYPVYTYDFDNDTLVQVTTFKSQAEIYGNYENSWSPDETLWGYALAYPNEDITSFRRVELLQLETGEIRQTCLGLFYKIEGSGNLQYTNGGYSPQFAWSRDGHYLALTGVLEGEDMNETFGIYLFDTQTSDIYEVYRGRANIVGWMANLSDS